MSRKMPALRQFAQSSLGHFNHNSTANRARHDCFRPIKRLSEGDDFGHRLKRLDVEVIS